MKYIKSYILEKLKIDKNTKLKVKTYPKKLTKDNYKEFFDIPQLSINVKYWYHKKYKTDPIWKDLSSSLTFKNCIQYLMAGNNEFDNVITDSVLRERIFQQISKVCNIKYDDLYYIWLNL